MRASRFHIGSCWVFLIVREAQYRPRPLASEKYVSADEGKQRGDGGESAVCSNYCAPLSWDVFHHSMIKTSLNMTVAQDLS